jgi:hypothetical protein
MRSFLLQVIGVVGLVMGTTGSFAFQQGQQQLSRQSTYTHQTTAKTILYAQVSQQEAQKGIDKVVAALRKDKSANQELGRLEKVNNILGFGSPTAGSLAVRFNASFKKGGFGLSSVPMPFGLGQTNESEGRGTMVGQVKASIDTKTGKITSCSVFRDLGYGRAFNLKV